MKIASLASLALLTVLAPLAAGCAADDASGDGVAEAEANAAGVVEGKFKLYDEPQAEPNPMCDVHTSLTLSNRDGGRADLDEVVGGDCEIYVPSNPRFYRLRDAGTECGSRIYAGSFRRGGETYAIRITDHRARACRDLVPALVVVEETRVPQGASPVTTMSFSHDAPGVESEEAVEVTEAGREYTVKQGQEIRLRLSGPMPTPLTGWRVVQTTRSLGYPETSWEQGEGAALASGTSVFVWQTGPAGPISRVGTHHVALEIERSAGEAPSRFEFTVVVTP